MTIQKMPPGGAWYRKSLISLVARVCGAKVARGGAKFVSHCFLRRQVVARPGGVAHIVLTHLYPVGHWYAPHWVSGLMEGERSATAPGNFFNQEDGRHD